MTAQENTGERSPPGDAVDHYRLLQLDPDAPHELIAEAYWYAVGKLRAERAFSRSTERELDALSAAYATLVVPEDRQAYDASEPRVTELRRGREKLKREAQRRPLLSRLLGRPPARRLHQALDYYALLSVDPAADLPLIARAYSILRTLHSDGIAAGQWTPRSMAEVEEACAVLLDPDRREAYDRTLRLASQRQEADAGAVAEPKAAAPPTVQPSPPGPLAEPPTRERGREEKGKWARRTGLLLRSAGQATIVGYRHASHWALYAARWLSLAAGWIWASLRRAARYLAELRTQHGATLPDDLLIPRLRRDVVTHRAVELPSQMGREDAASVSRARLLITAASGQHHIVALGGEPMTLGTDPTCDILLETQESVVAPEHARIWRSGSSFVIHSLSSHHRTVIEGRNVVWAVLEDGDRIEIGQNRLTFEAPDSGQEVPDHLTKQRVPG